MNTLKLVKIDGELYADSRDVARFLGRKHARVMKTIRNCGYGLMKTNLVEADFFEAGEYPDDSGRKRPCWLITKDGCQLLASRICGVQGVAFAVACKNAFEKYGRSDKKQTSANRNDRELNEISKQLRRLEKLIDCITPIENNQ